MPGNLAYKGSVFSYSSSGSPLDRSDVRPSIRDYLMEADSVKALEETFVDHLHETIISKLIPQMASGIPSLSIPSLDPLRLDEINVTPAVGDDRFHLKLNNIEIRGLSDVDVQDVRPKLNALKVRVALAFPKIITNCHFDVNGSLYQMVKVNGEGLAELDYRDVTFRSQLHLSLENGTMQVVTSDPPVVDFGQAKIRLFTLDMNKASETSKANDHNSNSSEPVERIAAAEIGMKSEVSPLLFWVLADHIVQEVDEYVLKYLNTNMLSFKVPDTFSPLITWFMNRSGTSSMTSTTSSSSSSSSSPSFISLHNSLGHQHMFNPFGMAGVRFSPIPLINQFLSSMTSFRGPHISIDTRNLMKRGTKK